ncbi:MAG: hypothetical protein Ct9H300mP11_23800 [Chloroflexota bacterium]|nr:MAG: hypothetical protein Ct9H300mP11_23800 [Chloroflexota bacterium]
MPDSTNLKMENNVAVAMRDGVTLYAGIYRPDGEGPYPTILQRTPYDKTTSLTNTMLDPIRLRKPVSRALFKIHEAVTVRGRILRLPDDIDDGYDTVEWAAAQDWSNGKVGMYGALYVGATQWLAATSRPPI